MKVLFDQNVPRNLLRILERHDVVTSRSLGWDTLVNGDLLDSAEQAGFEVLVTGDRNLEYQQFLSNRRIALIGLTRNNWPLVRPHTDAITAAIDRATPGSYHSVDCSPKR